jgi:hypothetical protein
VTTTDVQSFERHPQLARWIEKIASVGNQFSWATWCAFLREINRALDTERERSRSIHIAGSGLLRALESYGFPVSDAASTADMSVEARNLHNAARRFQRVCNSTGSIVAEPAVTNGRCGCGLACQDLGADGGCRYVAGNSRADVNQ